MPSVGGFWFWLSVSELSAAWANRALAQTEPATDLSTRIDSLEKQLADLKSQMEAQKAAAAAAAAPAPAPAAAALPAACSSGHSRAHRTRRAAGTNHVERFRRCLLRLQLEPARKRTTALRNFDVNSSQFALNMIELVADKAPDATGSRVGYHVALGFGQAMNLVNAGEVASPNVPGTPLVGPPSTITNFDQYLKEGYLEYLAPVGKGLQINVGKFVTPAGAEVIETKDNWNYSRGLLFSWAIPYFHFGMSGKYAFNSKFALTGYLMNGWNNSVDNNSGKTTGFTAAWTPNSKFGLIENYLVGPEQGNDNSDFRHLTDTVVTYSPNCKTLIHGELRLRPRSSAAAAPGITVDPSMVERHSWIHQVRSQRHVGDRHSRRMVQGPQRVLDRHGAERWANLR